jgi:hypothetical protein
MWNSNDEFDDAAWESQCDRSFEIQQERIWEDREQHPIDDGDDNDNDETGN